MIKKPYRPPHQVAVMTALFVISGLYFFILAVMDVSESSFLSAGLSDTLSAVVLMVNGLLSIMIGYGSWVGWKTMWYLGLVFSILILISSLITATLWNIPTALMIIIALWLLVGPEVRTYFKSEHVH
mgnify:CR=1 FL=1